MNRDTKQSCHHPSNSLKYIYKTQAVFPRLVPVLWGTKESHRTAECEESLREPCAVEANRMAREHRRKEGHRLMTKAGQHGDFLRLQGTLDHCLLKAVKLMNEVKMDGPKRRGAMLGGGALSDAEEQQGTQRAAGSPNPGVPQGQNHSPVSHPAVCSCTKSCRLLCFAACPETNWSRQSSPRPLL